MNGIDLVVTQNLRLPIRVDEQLAQGEHLCSRPVGLEERRDRDRIEAHGMELFVGQVAGDLQRGVENISGRNVRRAARRRDLRRAVEDVARIARQHDVCGGSLQLGGGIRHGYVRPV